MDVKRLAWFCLTGVESDALHTVLGLHGPEGFLAVRCWVKSRLSLNLFVVHYIDMIKNMDEGDPLIPLEERTDDDDDGNTTQSFQPGASSTPGPSGECYLIHTTTMNRTSERRHIQETSFIRAVPRGRINNAEDQRIIRAQSILEGLYPDYNSEGAMG